MTGDDATEWDPIAYDSDAGFVAEYGESVLELLDPRPGERVLDLGCGTGHLTAELAERVAPDGRVVGIDSSPEMVREAREAYPHLAFECVDAREFAPADLTCRDLTDGDLTGSNDAAPPAVESFDAVFTNAALHWIPRVDQDAVTARVADALGPGGRFVGELGGTGNVATVVGAVRAELRERGYERDHPWYFPTVGEHAQVLESGGFEVRHARLFDRPTALDGEQGLRNWLDVFGDSLFAGLDDSERDAVVRAVEDRLRPERYDPDTETWTLDYRRLRFAAVWPGPDG